MAKSRQISIDYMKSMLVIGMILAHSFQLLSKNEGNYWLFSTLINLFTFSGFFFCYGYVFFLSYFSKNKNKVKKNIIATACKTLVAYYIVAFFSLSLIYIRYIKVDFEFSFINIFRVLLLFEIPFYTEFLLSFFLITIIAFLFFDKFVLLAENRISLFSIIGICLVWACLAPTNLFLNNQLALLVGTSSYSAFPVIQYLPFFLVGILFSKYGVPVNLSGFCLSLIGTFIFVIYVYINKNLPSRFPPSIFWILGSTGILYSLFAIAKFLEYQNIVFNFIISIGSNALIYLVLSNIMIFSLSKRFDTFPIIALAIGGLIILFINFLISLVKVNNYKKEEVTSERLEIVELAEKENK
jgi:hypothetical protein